MELLLRDVSKAYEGKTVLSHFSCAIAEGCRCAVMAPSGAGKTTLFRILNGMMECDSGTILLDGVRLNSGNKREKRSRLF